MGTNTPSLVGLSNTRRPEGGTSQSHHLEPSIENPYLKEKEVIKMLQQKRNVGRATGERRALKGEEGWGLKGEEGSEGRRGL